MLVEELLSGYVAGQDFAHHPQLHRQKFIQHVIRHTSRVRRNARLGHGMTFRAQSPPELIMQMDCGL